MKKIFITTFLACISIVAHADQSKKAISPWLDFELNRGHIYIDITIKGKPAKAVVDTGATLSAISEDFAKKIGVSRSKNRKDKIRVQGLAGTRLMTWSRLSQMAIPGIMKKKIKFVMFDTLDGIDVILGMDVFAFEVTQIDYSNNKMRFASHNAFKFDPEASIPLKKRGNRYLLNAKINEVDLAMLLDTGNAGSIIVPYADAENTSLLSSINGIKKETEKGGIHEKKLPLYSGVSDNFNIGPYTLDNVRYKVIAEDKVEAVRRPVLGYDILKHFLVTIDLKERNLYLSTL